MAALHFFLNFLKNELFLSLGWGIGARASIGAECLLYAAAAFTSVSIGCVNERDGKPLTAVRLAALTGQGGPKSYRSRKNLP